MDENQLRLLSEKEVDDLYYTLDEFDRKSVLLFCSDDLKMEEFTKLDFWAYDIFKIIMSFKDINKGKQAYYNYMDKDSLGAFSFNSQLTSCDVNYRVDFINLICEYLEQKPNFDFSLYDVGMIIELCENANDDEKEQLLDRMLGILESRAIDTQISSTWLEKVINAFSIEKRLDIFNKFVELYKSGKLTKMDFSLSGILEVLPDENKFDFLSVFLVNDLLDTPYYISEVFKTFSDELKDDVIDFIQEYEVNSDKDIIDNYVMALLLENYEEKIRLEKFRTLVMADKKYNHFSVMAYISDVNFKFAAMNLKVGNVSSYIADENKHSLFLLLSRIINKHFENYGDKFPDNNIIYDDLINFYVDFLGVNKDNLVKFIEKFGYVSLRYLDNDNVRNVINLDGDKFGSFMNLFRNDNLKLDSDAYNTVINAILQREFMVQCKDEYNIFARIEELINNSLMEDVEKIILEIAGVVNIKKILSTNNIDVKAFLNRLLKGEGEMLNLLHEITNQYIMKKRENYVKERMKNVNDELDLDKKYEKNFIKKKWLATTSEFNISCDIRYCVNDEVLNQEQLFLRDNQNILEKIIKFKKNPSEYILEDEYKKYLKVFDSLVDILYINDKLKDPTNDPNAKYIYSAKNIELYNFIDLISELDIKKIDKLLLSNKTLLNSLDEILSKYKLLGWGNTFNALSASADFDFSNSSLVGLFEYFYKINYEIMNTGDKKFGLTKMVSLANCCSSVSSKYGLLLGDDVFRLIAANEGNNKASMVRYKRLQLSCDHIVGMYNRDNIPVPPIDCNVQIEDLKKMNVVVGNVTDMQNLVLGELTNSCMRIGGAFYDFYEECLQGQVGFHIVLTDPNTNKFVSRVSGIRNGNTLFLNELRNSEHEEYTNEDCVMAIKEVSKTIIEASKSSEFPIDNVVITADYAMGEHKDELINLNLSDRNEALFGLKHNLDVGGVAILLASSSNDGKLVDISIGKEKISYYKPQRGKVKEYVGEEAVRRVVQLETMVNNLLNGVSMADINLDMDMDVVRCISGSDWYIAYDSNNNIKRFILDNSKDKARALDEMSRYMSIINNDDINIKKGVSK